ncbi:MAG TPA: helicase C-terminal domain-containing protein, partial [Ktedonobacterales bacterium]|nr:helicase C-terminal domain-containing protein [Ktedonobacterales bacterium]
ASDSPAKSSPKNSATVRDDAYAGLLPLAASLLAQARGEKRERGEQGGRGDARPMPRWRPTGRERGWFEALTRAQTQVETLFKVLQLTLIEAQNEATPGQNGDFARGAQHGSSGGHATGRKQGAQTEQRTLLLDAHACQTNAWEKSCEAWRSLDRSLGEVATLAREVAGQVRSASQTATSGARRRDKQDKDTRSARAAPGSASPIGTPIPSGVALGLTTDLLAVARRLDHLRTQGATLFAPLTSVDDLARWLRLPYTETPSLPGAEARGGRVSREQSAQRKQPSGAAVLASQTAPLPRDAAPDEAHAASAEIAIPEEEAASEIPIADTDPANAGELVDSPDAGAEAAQTPPAEASPSEEPATAQTPHDEAPHSEAPILHAAPTQVGGLLKPLLAPDHALTLAGWALSVGGDFEYMRGVLALPESAAGVALTPDYAHQTLLCLPNDVPEPNAPHFQQRLDEAIVALATTLGGQLVALFPSHAALRSGAFGVRRTLERHNILALAQGIDGSARQLWQTFHSQPRVVLLGAGSFWDGADQRDSPPACVVVTRVPFPALSDPLMAARAEGWADPQTQFVTPQAALKLRQSLGGLAWSHQRRNAIVLFDRRLQTRGYGPNILSVLPRCAQAQEPMTRLVERIAEWTA